MGTREGASWLHAFWLIAGIGVGLAAAASCRSSSAPPQDEPQRSPPAAAPTSSATGQPDPARTPIVDAHVHLSPEGASHLRELMRRYGFDHVVNLSGGHPFGGLPEQLKAAQRARGTITVFAGLAYEQAARPGYGQRMAKALELSHAMGARGLKVVKGLGLALRGPDGKLLPVDDPELDAVFDKAGQLGMPVSIHSGDPEAFFEPVTPENERYAELQAHPKWAVTGADQPSFGEILAQLERRIARHPNTTFISVHFGNCAEHPDRVAQWLRTYPNLYIDTAARIPELGRHRPEKMRVFFEEFQDRILYGSDLGVGPEDQPLFLGSSGPEPPTDRERELFFTATRRYFETADRQFDHPTPIQGNWKIDGIKLSQPVLRKIYGANAVRLLGLAQLAR